MRSEARHAGVQTKREANSFHADGKDPKQHSHSNAIEGNQPKTLNVVHCEKIIYTN